VPASEFGRVIFLVGILIAGTGFALWLAPGWFGRLPEDFHYQRGNFSVHFPFVTCLLLSVVLSALLWLFRR